MNKTLGSILLIAGTCIGSGMIALPLVLSKLGILLSIVLMLITWSIMYYSSLINLELNLQAGQGLTLGQLGRRFSGKTAELIGTTAIKLLSYALLSAYLCGGSSMITQIWYRTDEFSYATGIYACVCGIVLLLPIHMVDYVNRMLFIGLLSIIITLIAALSGTIDWATIPLMNPQGLALDSWYTAIPVVFTSFGFQVIFHTLTNYCEKNASMLKRAFFWGSGLPAIVYICWTSGALSALYNNSPEFYKSMVAGSVGIGSLIDALSSIVEWKSLQVLIQLISFLAITTSIIGVGIGLNDSLIVNLQTRMSSAYIVRIIAALLTIMPAYAIAHMAPHAFITILGFAGMILVVIALLLPVYLLSQAQIQQWHYPILKQQWLTVISVLFGIVVMLCELHTLFF